MREGKVSWVGHGIELESSALKKDTEGEREEIERGFKKIQRLREKR